MYKISAFFDRDALASLLSQIQNEFHIALFDLINGLLDKETIDFETKTIAENSALIVTNIPLNEWVQKFNLTDAQQPAAKVLLSAYITMYIKQFSKQFKEPVKARMLQLTNQQWCQNNDSLMALDVTFDVELTPSEKKHILRSLHEAWGEDALNYFHVLVDINYDFDSLSLNEILEACPVIGANYISFGCVTDIEDMASKKPAIQMVMQDYLQSVERFFKLPEPFGPIQRAIGTESAKRVFNALLSNANNGGQFPTSYDVDIPETIRRDVFALDLFLHSSTKELSWYADVMGPLKLRMKLFGMESSPSKGGVFKAGSATNGEGFNSPKYQ